MLEKRGNSSTVRPNTSECHYHCRFSPFVGLHTVVAHHSSTWRFFYSVLRALRAFDTLSDTLAQQMEARAEADQTAGHQSEWLRDGDAEEQ